MPRHSLLYPDSIPLLQTKLRLPFVPAGYVPRPRLVTRLNDGLHTPLTLLSAPAGFGKTTAVAAWCAQLKPLRAAWLSLDASDDDAARFLAYLWAAFANIDARRAGARMDLTPPHAPQAMLTHLLNAFADYPEPFVLVMDDTHLLESAGLNELLAFLVEHCPTNLHLIFATRADPAFPLAGLRARGRLNEIRVLDLRFTFDETLAFFNEANKLNLARADIHTLDARAEGWIAGLQLAALSLREQQDRAKFLTAFSGSHRFVLDYLVEQVLVQQSEARQNFLLETALLERMNASLANAVTGRHDAQAQLQWLEAHNLFLIPLDPARQWYRYHHLFAEFLRHRLRQQARERVVEIYRRAAEWHAAQNEPTDAIGYALAADDFEFAARLLEQEFDRYWTQGQFATLKRWFAQLPHAFVEQQPRLLISYAWFLYLTGDYARPTMRALLNVAERKIKQFPARQRRVLRGMLTAVRASDNGRFGETQAARVAAQRALKDLPKSDFVWRLNALMALANAFEMDGDVNNASDAFAQVIALGERTNIHYTRLVAMRHLATLRGMQGRFDEGAALYERVIAELSPYLSAEAGSGAPYVGLGEILYEWNELERAEKYLVLGINSAAPRQEFKMLIEAGLCLALVKRAQGKITEMQSYAHQVQEWLNVPETRLGAFPTNGFRAWAALVQDEPMRERVWAEKIARQKIQPGRYAEFEAVVAARVLLALGEFVMVAKMSVPLTRAAAKAGRTVVAMESGALRAAALYQQGRRAEAMAVLQQILVLGEPTRLLRAIVDLGEPIRGVLQEYVTQAATAHMPKRARELAYAKKLLALCMRTETPRTHSAMDSLSPRELEVLQHVVNGASNQEIADALVVAVSTVKAHTNTIYSKLGVTSRAQAIRRAHELHLI